MISSDFQLTARTEESTRGVSHETKRFWSVDVMKTFITCCVLSLWTFALFGSAQVESREKSATLNVIKPKMLDRENPKKRVTSSVIKSKIKAGALDDLIFVDDVGGGERHWYLQPVKKSVPNTPGYLTVYGHLFNQGRQMVGHIKLTPNLKLLGDALEK